MNITELLNYNMTMEEKFKAYIANEILNAFNGSYKPHCFFNKLKAFNDISIEDGIFKTIYIKEFGYTLIYYEDHGNKYVYNKFIKLNPNRDIIFQKEMTDYIIYTIQSLGLKDINLDNILNNSAIQHLCSHISYENFDIDIALPKTLSDGFIAFCTSNWNENDKLELIGFKYYDRNIWCCEL